MSDGAMRRGNVARARRNLHIRFANPAPEAGGIDARAILSGHSTELIARRISGSSARLLGGADR